SFSVYELSAQENGARCVCVPAKDFAVDLDAIAAAVDATTRLVFITNPNNPTGLALTESAIDAFGKDPARLHCGFGRSHGDYLAPEEEN
ncbi:MAG: aminotransferase class I/II-fold pyridoxal phosphate-dependent enzyme, partial [Duodenibacillus massiliensis]